MHINKLRCHNLGLIFCIGFISFFSLNVDAQNIHKADSIRGSITPEREWWNLKHYELRVTINPDTKTVVGSNKIRFEILNPNHKFMQIDLQEPMQIDSIVHQNNLLEFSRSGMAHFIRFPKDVVFHEQERDSLTIYFSGNPIEAKNAPWDGGIIWDKDANGDHFAASAVQGIGASVWWPTKEHSYDKPDEGVDLYYTTDNRYAIIGNGRLISSYETGQGKRTWHWQVQSPINNYNVSFNLGKYTTIKDTYNGLNGELDLTYYPLALYKSEAIEHFSQVTNMLEAMEFWFGPYPFYKDGYKLTQAPFVGMEHQSNVAWGNGFQQGYTGNDISNSGYGLTFDFMIVHESIHEWFGNSLTHNDIADMWLHEGFTSYGEALYVEYFHGKDAGQAYTRGTRDRINNETPIQGKYGIHDQPSSDIYYKGANVLLTLRQIINDDKIWREILQHLQQKFKQTSVDSEMVENEIARMANKDLQSFFDVYLRQAQIPSFEWYVKGSRLFYRYQEVPNNFVMPIRLFIDKQEVWLEPNTKWKKHKISKGAEVQLDSNFYVNELNTFSKNRN